MILIPRFPVSSCSEEGNDILRKARGKYTNILIGYHDEVFVELTAVQRVERLRLQLEFLTKLGVVEGLFKEVLYDI